MKAEKCEEAFIRLLRESRFSLSAQKTAFKQTVRQRAIS